MAKIPNEVEILPKISTVWVGCMSVTDKQTDDRQTDGRQHIANVNVSLRSLTRRPSSADRTARRQFQAIGQPVSRTQASDAMTSRLPRYEAKCVQRRCFQWGSVPLRSDIKGTELPPANIVMPLERQLTALQLCRWQLLYNETLQQTFRPLWPKVVWKTRNLGIWSLFWGS